MTIMSNLFLITYNIYQGVILMQCNTNLEDLTDPHIQQAFFGTWSAAVRNTKTKTSDKEIFMPIGYAFKQSDSDEIVSLLFLPKGTTYVKTVECDVTHDDVVHRISFANRYTYGDYDTGELFKHAVDLLNNTEEQEYNFDSVDENQFVIVEVGNPDFIMPI
jgi:hypothetical protein